MNPILAWLYNRVWLRHIITTPCRGIICTDSSWHDAHLTRFGKWWLAR